MLRLVDILEAALRGGLEPYHEMQLARFVPVSFKSVQSYEADRDERWAVLHLEAPWHLLGRREDHLDVNDGSVRLATVHFDRKGRPLSVHIYG